MDSTLEQTDQHSLAYRCLDVVISYVLEVFVVLFWHGLWTLEDLYSNQCGIEYEMSAWISVVSSKSSIAVSMHQNYLSRSLDFWPPSL